MQEFIDFIEEVVDVKDQTDPNADNIIHAFYRDHNTLNKMNENFRLLEYKRKKYVEKQKNSRSPPKNRTALAGKRANGGIEVHQKNFLTTLYGGQGNNIEKQE